MANTDLSLINYVLQNLAKLAVFLDQPAGVLKITFTSNRDLFAVEVEARRTLCDENIFVSMPDDFKTCFSQLINV